MLQPLDPVMLARMQARAVEPAGQRLVERLDDQGRFAAARDAGDAGEGAERNIDGDVLQIVGPRADDAEASPRAGRRRRCAGIGIWRMPDQIWPGQAVRVLHHLVRRAGGDDLAAIDPGARPHVDQIVGGADRLLVMLDHQHGIAEVAQPLQRLQQPGIVALMQADGGLVQHIEHAGEAGADLGGQPDALALAAGERAGGAAQGQIFEPDAFQETQPLVDLLQDALGDLALLGRQLAVQRPEPVAGLGDGEIGDLGDVEAGDLDRQRLGLQALALADLAGAVVLVARRAPRAPSCCRSRGSGAPCWG